MFADCCVLCVVVVCCVLRVVRCLVFVVRCSLCVVVLFGA